MHRLSINEIKGGEILAKPICTRENEIILPRGAMIKREYVSKLSQLGIQDVFVKDNASSLMEVTEMKEEVERGVSDKIKDLMAQTSLSESSELKEIVDTVGCIISNILEDERIVEKVIDIKERSTDIYEHSINVCSFSILTAVRMGLTLEEAHDIGIGALLHDVGLKYTTTDYSVQSSQNLSEQDTNEYSKHPIYGYSLVKEVDYVPEVSKQIILCHHETMDGKGFPLKKHDISLECNIVNICDTFDEMICGISCRKIKYQDAIDYLKTYRGVKYNKEAIDAFMSFVAVFPTGSKVLTSEGEIGIVVKQNELYLDKPILHMLVDSEGKEITKRVIKNLAKLEDVHIVKIVEERQ